MASLGRVGWHTTALVGREVKRTFSEFRGLLAGLLGAKTPEASGQDFGDFGQMLGRGFGGHAPWNDKR